MFTFGFYKSNNLPTPGNVVVLGIAVSVVVGVSTKEKNPSVKLWNNL